jgi:hypothetical protein
VKTSGAASAYTPSARITVMLPWSAWMAACTFFCAWVMEHGSAISHAVPVPVGAA